MVGLDRDDGLSGRCPVEARGAVQFERPACIFAEVERGNGRRLLVGDEDPPDGFFLVSAGGLAGREHGRCDERDTADLKVRVGWSRARFHVFTFRLI